MNCRDWEERIALYAGGEAGAAEAAAVETHLAECAGCRASLGALRRSMDLLREAHREPVEEAHFAAVRARVMAEIARAATPWWRRGWVYGAALAAAVVMVAVAVRPAAKVQKKDNAVAVVRTVETPPPAEEIARPVRKKVHVVRKAGDERRSPAPPLLVKLITDDPDVVIYWIADGRGE